LGKQGLDHILPQLTLNRLPNSATYVKLKNQKRTEVS